MSKPKILFLVTEDWYFWSHRLPLARAARDSGYEVSVATRVDGFGERIRAEGFKLHPLLHLRRRSKNPLRELLALGELVRLYRRERPDLVHHVALKPVIYGSMAARLARIQSVVNAFAGLGFVFITPGLKAGILRRFVSLAYKISLSAPNMKVIFQNQDDIATFVENGLVSERDVVLIKSSGVDLSLFSPVPEPEGGLLVVLAGRMLWDKGVGEYVAAAASLRARGVKARFALVGDSDPANPASVPGRQLEEWRDSGAVEWWGRRTDMPEVLAQSHIACLPSYREGLPKFLVEAAARSRAIVATDVPGCREIVRHGENGFLVPARDPEALAEALGRLLEDSGLRGRMGARGRQIAAEYSVDKVTRQTLSVYGALRNAARP